MGGIVVTTNPAVEVGRPSQLVGFFPGQDFSFKGPCLTTVHRYLLCRSLLKGVPTGPG